MKIKSHYRVDLKEKTTWNIEFLRNCEENKFIFKVMKMKPDGEVVLYRTKECNKYSIWNHEASYGEFIDDPSTVPIDIKIDEGLFEI
jgi:hypothetical protein